MAKLTDVSEGTTIDSDDLLYYVDVSDTTDDPAGTSKAISRSNFGGAGVPSMEMASKIKLAEVIGVTDQPMEIVIPSGYDRIIIEGQVASENAAAIHTLRCFFNGDTTAANYLSQRLSARDGTTSTSESISNAELLIVPGAASSSLYGTVRILIEDPDSTDVQRHITGYYSAPQAEGTVYVGVTALQHDSMVAALTSLTLQPNGGVDGVVGKLTVYGEKVASVGAINAGSETITAKKLLGSTEGTDVASLVVSDFDLTGYDRMVVEVWVRSHEAVIISQLYAYLNGDTTNSNYGFTLNAANATDAFEDDGALPAVAYVPANTATSGSYGKVTLVMENPNGGALQHLRSSFSNAEPSNLVNQYSGTASLAHDSSTDSPTSIQIQSDVGNVTGRVKVYGEKEITIGLGEELFEGPGTQGKVPDPITSEGRALLDDGTWGPSFGVEQTDIVVKTLIQEIDLTTTAGSFDFNNIPQDFDRLVISGNIRSDAAVATDLVKVEFNEDTTEGNYSRQNNLGNNGSAASNEVNNNSLLNVVGASVTDGWASIEMWLPQYSVAGRLKNALTTVITPNLIMDSLLQGTSGMQSSITDALTRVRILTDNDPTDQLFGTLRLYGEKTQPMGTINAGTETITTKKLIQKIDLATADGFDFDSIPQDFDRLTLTGYVKSTGNDSGNVDDIHLYFNGDTTEANYFSSLTYALDVTTSNVEENSARIGQCAGSGSDRPGRIDIAIGDYNTSNLKTVTGYSTTYRSLNTTMHQMWTFMGHDTMVAPVTRIQVRVDNHPTDGLTGELYLYGEKEITVGLGELEFAGAGTTGYVPDPVTAEGRNLRDDGTWGPSFGIDTNNIEIKELIQEQTSTVGAVFDFDNIPADYDRLIIEGSITGSGAEIERLVEIFFNEDTTGSNYHAQRSAVGDNNAVGGQEYADSRVGRVTAQTAPTDSVTRFRLEIEGHSDSNLKIARSTYTTYKNTDIIEAGSYSVVSAVSAALTRIRIQTDNSPTSDLIGGLKLYGEKEVQVGTINAGTETITVKKEIARVSNATAGNFQFTGIPAGYDRLIIKGKYRGDSAVTNVSVNCYINGDETDTNYLSQWSVGWNAGALNNELEYPSLFEAPAATALANAYAELELTSEGYDDGVSLQLLRAKVGYRKLSTGVSVGDTIIVHDSSTDPITELLIKPTTGGLLGELTLYGEKEITVGLGELEFAGAGTTGYVKDPGTAVGKVLSDSGEFVWNGGSDTKTVETKTLLAEITNATAGDFDFTSISQDYDKLLIEGEIRSDATTTNDIAHGFLNGDETLTNYSTRQFFNASTNGAVANESRVVPSVTGASSPAGYMTKVAVEIHDYTDDQTKLIESRFWAQNAATDVRAGFSYVRSSITGPVTQFRLATDNDPTDQLTGTLRLYGVKEDAVGTINAGSVDTLVQVPLQTISIDVANAGEMDFTDIPAGYDRLVFKGKIRSTTTGTDVGYHMYVNESLTGTDYRMQQNIGSGGVSAGAAYNFADFASGPGAGSPAGSWSVLHEVDIAHYDEADVIKQIQSRYSAYLNTDTAMSSLQVLIAETVTDPVTRIRMRASNHPTGGLYGEVTMYGEKSKSIGIGELEFGGAGTHGYVPDPVTSTGKLLGDDGTWKVAALPGTKMAETKTLIQQIDLTTAGEFDFPNLPTDYDSLVLEINARTDDSAASDGLYIYFDDDLTGTNYRKQDNGAEGGSTSNTTDLTANIAPVPAAGSSSGSMGYCVITLAEYKDSTTNKIAHATTYAYRNGTSALIERSVTHVANTDSISRIRVRAGNHPTDGVLGSARLYGIKQEPQGVINAGSEVITTKKLVEEITLDTAGAFTFDYIPEGEGNLIVEGYIRGSISTDTDDITLEINGTTTGWYQQDVARDGSVLAGEASGNKVGIITAGSNPSEYYSTFSMVLEDYSGANAKVARSSFVSRGNAGSQYTGGIGYVSAVTDTVTSLSIQTDDHPTNGLVGKLALYIEKDITVGVGQLGTKVPIQSITNATADDFDFNNIPQGYRRLILEGYVRSGVAATSDYLYMWLNEDTTAANYHSQRNGGDNGSHIITEIAEPRLGYSTGASSPAGSYAHVRLVLEGYASTVLKKMAQVSLAGEYDTDNMFVENSMVFSAITDPVTRVRVLTDNDPTDQLLGELTLYGEY